MPCRASGQEGAGERESNKDTCSSSKISKNETQQGDMRCDTAAKIETGRKEEAPVPMPTTSEGQERGFFFLAARSESAAPARVESRVAAS